MPDCLTDWEKGIMAEKCMFNPEKECLGLLRAEQLAHDLNKLREQSHESHDKLWSELRKLQGAEAVRNEQYKHIIERLDTLAANNQDFKKDNQIILAQLPVLANKVDTLEENQRALVEDVSELKSKSGKKWDGMIAQITSILIATVVGLIIGKIGL